MRNFNAFYEEARVLYESVKTVWDNYDFDERSTILERRVPKLKFPTEVVHMLEEVTHICGRKEKYVRECQVKFNDHVYIFEISTRLSDRKVIGYFLEVYTPVGDGVGGKHLLFAERI